MNSLIQLDNSGKEVPPETITTTIANNEMFIFFPKLTDPLIIISAPNTKRPKPIIAKKIFITNFYI